MKVNWLHVILACLMFWIVGFGPALMREAKAGSGESLKMQEG